MMGRLGLLDPPDEVIPLGEAAVDYGYLFKQWADKYRPIDNQLVKDALFNGTMFEIYGAEHQLVLTTPATHVWTLVDGDEGQSIVAGYWTINRIGYFITEESHAG